MSDYIKREYVMREILEEYGADTDNEDVDMIFDMVINAPSYDVAPVRHGHWIFNQEDMTLTCSCCEDVYHFDDADLCLDFMEYAKYCLTCGARMDERRDDE